MGEETSDVGLTQRRRKNKLNLLDDAKCRMSENLLCSRMPALSNGDIARREASDGDSNLGLYTACRRTIIKLDPFSLKVCGSPARHSFRPW